jgi:hypothetical protein
MFKKATLAVVAVLVLALAAVPAVFADGGDDLIQVEVDDVGVLPAFNDGRVNMFDLDAPVVIYNVTETVPGYTDEGSRWSDDGELVWEEQLIGIDLWVVNPAMENVEKLMFVSVQDINAAIAASAGQDVTIASAQGYSLNYSADGWLWVTAPNGYSYAWEIGSFLQ